MKKWETILWRDRLPACYLGILFLFTCVLCLFNMLHGFGEDSDATRVIEHALKSRHLHEGMEKFY